MNRSGQKSGYGRQVTVIEGSITCYEGMFDLDKANGLGKFTTDYGVVQEGMFKNGDFHLPIR